LGKRLLEGSPSCRLWACFLSGIGALLSTSFAVWLVYDSFQSTGQSTFPFAVAHHAMIAASAVFTFCTLQRGDIRDWFLMPRTEPARGGSWAFPVSMILGILLARQLITDQLYRQELSSLFHVATTVTLNDGETGERLRNLRYDSDVLNSGSRSRSPLPRLSARLHISSEEVALKLEGIVSEPFEVTFNSDGYSSQTVRFTRSTPETLTLAMDRQP
jgi:hypothetical protein